DDGNNKPNLKEVFGHRKTLVMLGLGFASGLPYAVLTGTLYAWLTAAEIDVATIGVLSWAGLAYAFKFLWSPLLDHVRPPLFARFGRRRGWIFCCQALVAACLFFISLADPALHIGWIALLAVAGAFAAATHDIAIDAWRIESAEAAAPLDLLSSAVQLGFRAAAFAGGAGALLIANYAAWDAALLSIAALSVVAMGATLAAPEPPAPSGDTVETPNAASAEDAPARPIGEAERRFRNLVLTPVLLGWAWAATALFGFMASAMTAETAPSARVFTLTQGPWIIACCVLAPGVAAAVIVAFRARPIPAVGFSTPFPGAMDALYRAILEPMVDLVSRLRYAAILILALVLSYRYADLVWGAFAYPFYLGVDNGSGALGHTELEVAFASKTFGVAMTFIGIFLGGVALLRFGRVNCLIAGAVLAAATNLLFADLAAGAAYLDGFLSATRLGAVYGLFDFDQRMARLMTAIAAENLAIGFASAVYVAFLSSIVNPKYSAVQYALLASLTMLIGTLGRPLLGELIEERGYAYVFVLTAVLGLVAVGASIGEAIRQSRTGAEEAPSGGVG
ncbi:MAG: MFS transporter, partial [Pseudomonadota bacterium]